MTSRELSAAELRDLVAHVAIMWVGRLRIAACAGGYAVQRIVPDPTSLFGRTDIVSTHGDPEAAFVAASSAQ